MRKDMKQFVRSIYALGLASLVMTGCAKDPSGPSGIVNKNKVQFSSNIDREVKVPGSRVSGTEWEYGDQVGIYMLWDGGAINNPSDIVQETADRSFDNRRFTININNKSYNAYDESQAIYYPLTNPDRRSFDFVAYYPYTAKEDMKDGYGIPIDITQNKPILMGEGSSEWYDYSDQNVVVPPVNLTFKHQMARIKLNVTGGEGVNDRDLKNMTVTFKNANAKGYYDIATRKFLSGVEKADVQFILKKNQPTAEEIEEGILEKDGSVGTLIMIPNTTAIDYRTIVFEVGHSENGTGDGSVKETYQITAKIPSTTYYAAGKEHVYNVTLTRTEAKFEQLVIEDWKPGPEIVIDPNKVETLKEREFYRAMYGPNTYVWTSSPRTSGTANKTDSYTIPLTKLFSMWANDEWLKELNKPELKEGEHQMIVEVIWADDPEIQHYTFGFSDALPKRSSTINITYGNLLPNNQTAKPMNAVIGIRVSTGEVSQGRPVYENFYRWCYHLWVTPGTQQITHTKQSLLWDVDGLDDGPVLTSGDLGFDPENPTKKGKTYEYRFLRRNLGAKEVEENTSSIGLYYQWGRPLPFPGPKDFTGTMTTLYRMNGRELEQIPESELENGMTKIINGEQQGVGFMFEDLKSFTAFVTSSTGNWIDPTLNTKLWNTDKKTAWNPCPLGWMVPQYKNSYPGDLLSPWNYYVLNSTSTLPADYKVAFSNDATKKGYSFTAINNPQTEYTIGWYPAAGYRDATTGAMDKVGVEGHYWASSFKGTDLTSFDFDATMINPYATTAKTAEARSVRCVKDSSYEGIQF